jgi:long-chain acyl-CoA synthetase
MTNPETFPAQEKDPRTIYDLFHSAAALHPDKTALMYKDQAGAYRSITYRELLGQVDRTAAALVSSGIARGDRVAIFSRNRPEWAVADLAVLKPGGIVVPIYQTLPPAAIAHILNDSESKLLFVENARLAAIVESIRDQVPSLARVVIFDPGELADRSEYLPFETMRDGYDETAASGPAEAAGGDDPATIVYTSGTTGEPKGAVLSHANIISNARAAINRFLFTPDDIILSYLPLCHMFERTCGYYTFLFAGARIAYAQDMTTIIDDIQQIRPTILIAVPRIIEKVHEVVRNKVLESSPVRRKLVTAAIRCLNDHANRTYQGLKIPFFLGLRRRFYDRAVASKFRKIAGGRLRLLVSGGAPLDKGIEKTLYVLDFNIVQGYGLTETSPVATCRSVADNRLGTVGKPLEGVEVTIGPNDEILIRGPNVMQGYFNRPEETARAIDEDGWFHTGDQGRFDGDGNLIITGRIKELIITSYGKNVAPVPIEKRLAHSPYVEQAVLVGDDRKYITALIVPRREAVERYAGERNMAVEDYAGLLREPVIRKLFDGEIDTATAGLPGFEQVKDYILLTETFTVDNGLLTPTLKARRKKILERYGREIDAMYETLTDQQ